MAVSGTLRIDFTLDGRGGKEVSVSGQMVMPGPRALDITGDVLFCLGLLAYAQLLLSRAETGRLGGADGPAIEIAPAGSLAALPKVLN